MNNKAETPSVKIEIQDNVGRITFCREKRGNSLSFEMALEIKKAVESLDQNDQVRVIVLTGSGEKFFCTGMDLNSQNMKKQQQGEETSSAKEDSGKEGLMNQASRFFEQIYQCKKPVISRINGSCFGGGFGLIFTTDIRIAVESAFFTFSEVKHGLVPAIISTYVIPNAGPMVSADLMLSGRRITAKEAHQLGLLHHVATNHQELDKITNEYIHHFLSNGPQAMRSVKSLIRYMTNNNHELRQQYARKAFREMMASPEAKYGGLCFVMRQKPDWNDFYKQQSKL